jgi:aryl-alcohol dehydrogenase-like predicted oxidoreductase
LDSVGAPMLMNRSSGLSHDMAYPHRGAPLRYRAFGGRRACTVGLGPCRERGEENPRALLAALGLGCNVFDTAAHLHRGAHERCVGEAVGLALSEGICDRDNLIVNLSVGRVPELVEKTIRTDGFGRLKALVEDEFVRRGIFGWSDLADGVHTIAPGFLRHTVERSLARTGLNHFDCVFVDSPTLQLKCVTPREFRRRFVAAVEALEGLCAEGSVRCYGIASTTPFDLAELVHFAKQAVGSAPRLQALRVPFSLLNPAMRPLIDKAAELGLYVFAAGALDGGTPLYQLPEALEPHLGYLSDAAAAIRWVESAPAVGTALFGSRDPRHVRANLAAAGMPPLDRTLYQLAEGEPK